MKDIPENIKSHADRFTSTVKDFIFLGEEDESGEE